MAYIVFDLDETLAELYSAYYFIATLNPERPDRLPEGLKPELDRAYKLFVNNVLKKELSDAPLGILRPGILSVFAKIQELKSNGQVNTVIIYSNNGHLQSLEFIRDLIHTYLGVDNLISDCVHWGHNMRKEERGQRVGSANKTWKVLSNILKEPHNGAPHDLLPTAVYFFDDQQHPNLMANLKINYINVPSYSYKASVDTIIQLFTDAINEAHVDKDTLLEGMRESYVKAPNTYDELLATFKHDTPGTSHVAQSTREDDGIKMMKDTLVTISESFPKSNPKSVGGAKRKRRYWNGKTRKQHRTNNHKRRRRTNKN
jgi:hypothetical protein